MRADKFLWAVRLFKTRADAAESCKSGRVIIDGISVKAARELKVGDLLCLRRPPVLYSYRILAIPPSRVGAPLVAQYIENLTPQSELDKLEIAALASGSRDRGAGRPTKRDRRLIENLTSSDD